MALDIHDGAGEARALLDEIRAALIHDGAHGGARLGSRACENLARLDRLLAEASPPRRAFGGLAPWQAARVRALVNRDLDGPLPVERLAEAAALGPSQFRRAFKRSFGAPPHAWVVMRRLDRAREMMLETDDPLSRIAVACGLTDQAHLTRLFRSRYDATPAAWRRARRERPAAPRP